MTGTGSRAARRLAGLFSRTTAAWNRYWFQETHPLNLAMARVGIACAVFWVLRKHASLDFAAFLATKDSVPYQPVGILKLFGTAPPSAAFFQVCYQVAIVATGCMLLGLLTRTATFISLISSLIVVSLIPSFQFHYSHGFHVVFLAQLAFLGADSGRHYSLDAIIRRRRGRNPLAGTSDGWVPAWPLLLSQLAVALVFFNAAYWKWDSDKLLAWVYSDSMRHHLVRRYYLFDEPVPALVEWILGSPWRWKLCALGNMVCQGLLIVACFVIRKPVLRFCFGLLLVFEVIGLGLVMRLWNPQWFPLFVLFVDWNYFATLVGRCAAWFRSRVAIPAQASFRPEGRFVRRRVVSGFVMLFLGVFGYVAFSGTVELRHRTLPFGCFRLYHNVAAKKPYLQPQTYELLRPKLDITSEKPLPPYRSYMFHRGQFWLIYMDDVQELEHRFAVFIEALSEFGPEKVDLRKLIVQVRPHPAPSKPVTTHAGYVARWSRDGGLQAVVAKTERDASTGMWYLDVQSVGLAEPEYRFAYILNDIDKPKPLAGVRVGNRYYFRLPEPGTYRFLAYVSDASAKMQDVPFFFLAKRFKTVPPFRSRDLDAKRPANGQYRPPGRTATGPNRGGRE